MEKWLNTLTNKQLKTWLKNMEYTTFMHLYTEEEKQNINIAKQVLKERAKQ